MRRFVLGWKKLGYARRFCAEIVCYADDFCVLGKAPAADMLSAVTRLMEGLKLTINEQKTRCLRCPEEPMEFLGYRFGWNYRRTGGRAYIGNRPSRASVQSICRKISEQTERRHGLKDPDQVVPGTSDLPLHPINAFNVSSTVPRTSRFKCPRISPTSIRITLPNAFVLSSFTGGLLWSGLLNW